MQQDIMPFKFIIPNMAKNRDALNNFTSFYRSILFFIIYLFW